ncbi:phosphodiester glycosidase family protein [Clostridium fallax]|uniref:Exopolysaccharide biosynthesis protein n=1 Tax=Clostridium fallax TaxID=1533 RepID=A0A1M4WTQ0_9CLOT|nr:Exopolysaccharide biosynthesis protein [Clostridium fallax]SQB07400.1 exported protein [Clostridium fallax]
MVRRKKNFYKHKKMKKKKFKWGTFFKFIIFELIFTMITVPFLIYYGPFQNVKRSLVGAAMTSLSHQYLATAFLSKDKINEILGENSIEEIKQDNNSQEVLLPKKHDDTIERYDIEGKKFKGYILVVKDPTRVKVGYSSKLGREGQTTSQIAKNFNAVAAINGGGFTDVSATSEWTGNGGTPTGIIISDGKEVFNDLKPDAKVEMMAITNKGRLLVGKYSPNELKKYNVTEAISFGPPLVVNGKPTIKTGDGGWGIAPRTVIGQRKDGSMLFLVIDGRQILNSIGATLKEAQDVMLQYGAVNAVNLDGGKSTTMYFEGEVINNPSDHLGERAVPSVVMVK